MALLEVAELTVEIATPEGVARLLDGVHLAVDRGEALGLVGESGCGKTMTALAVMGLLPEAVRVRGRILLEGRDLLGLDERSLCGLRGRRLAMVFQEPMTALNPLQSIGWQLAEGPRLHLGLSRTAAWQRAAQLLDRVGLPPARFPLDLYPHQLSGGQRQRVMVAMALACGPDLLIADEPTTALDVTVQAQLLDLIAEVAEDSGMALVMITHDLGVVAEMTDRVLVMYTGRVVESGPTAELFRRMAHPYTRGLFAAMPSGAVAEATAGRPRLAAIPGRVPDPTALPAACSFTDRCRFVTEICRREMPPDADVGPAHRALCFHPQSGPVEPS